MSTFYGSDTSCLYDIGLTDVQVTDPRVLIGQRLVRRLITPRGALALIGDDPNFGWDTRQLVNAKLGPSAKSNAETQIRAEVLKDEQVASAVVKLGDAQGGAIVISIQIVTSQGPFALTVNIGALTVGALFSFQAANT
jgi:hypothetical protein